MRCLLMFRLVFHFCRRWVLITGALALLMPLLRATPATPGPSTPVPKVINRASGVEQAKQDLAAGKVQLLEGGGIAVFAPEVPPNDPQLAKLPRSTVPRGCTTPQAAAWFEFAGGYNATVVEYIQRGVDR